MLDTIDSTAFNFEQGQRARKLFAAVVLAALDDAIADDKKYGNGPDQIARWARSRDGREVLSCAGIDPNERGVEALIMSPTRELCVQVASDLENYSQFAHQYKVVAVYGGAGIEGQIRQIKAGAQIIVATPGRLMDLMTRKAVRLDGVRRVVLDEADEMLNMGFKEAIDFILAAAEERESIWLFSATMPSEVRAIAAHYMNNPRELSTGNRNETNANIQHQFYLCRADDRFATLKRVVDANPGIYGLIFCRTKNDTKDDF